MYANVVVNKWEQDTKLYVMHVKGHYIVKERCVYE